jgi:uncharacterized protein YodC (DUF2158 family)
MQIGDIVKLKSGGPIMTVTDVWTDGNTIAVMWFDEQGSHTLYMPTGAVMEVQQ